MPETVEPPEDERTGAAEALRSVGQLALATAHEINNPLTVILGSLQLMVARGQVPDEGAGYVQRAIRAAGQIRDIVQNMSRVTRVELSRQASPGPALADRLPRQQQAGGAEAGEESGGDPTGKVGLAEEGATEQHRHQR